MPHMLRTLIAGAALAFLLASCSVVEDLAGPQQVSDPLGLHEVPVTLEPTATSAAGPHAGTQQSTTTYEASLGPATVPDIDTSGIPSWFDPDSLAVDVGFMSTVRLASVLATDENEFDANVTLGRATMAEFIVMDDEGEPRIDLDPISTPAAASVALTKQACTGVVPMTCTYEAQSGLDAFVVPVFVGGTAMNSLYTILTGGAPTNTARGSLQLVASGTVPADTTITITIDAPFGTLDP